MSVDVVCVDSLYQQHVTNVTVQPAGERKLPYNAAHHTGIRYSRDALKVSMVGMVLYSRCTETTVPCSPYWTCVQYGSDVPTVKKKKSPNSSWWNHKQHNNNQQQPQDNNAQTHQEWEGARQGSREKRRGKGRKKRKFEEGSGDECGVSKKMNVTPQCLQTG